MRMRPRALFRGGRNWRGAENVLRREVRVVDGCPRSESCARERKCLLRLVMVL